MERRFSKLELALLREKLAEALLEMDDEEIEAVSAAGGASVVSTLSDVASMFNSINQIIVAIDMFRERIKKEKHIGKVTAEIPVSPQRESFSEIGVFAI